MHRFSSIMISKLNVYKIVKFRETKGAYALEVEARDGAPSARPNSGGQPNSGKNKFSCIASKIVCPDKKSCD